MSGAPQSCRGAAVTGSPSRGGVLVGVRCTSSSHAQCDLVVFLERREEGTTEPARADPGAFET